MSQKIFAALATSVSLVAIAAVPHAQAQMAPTQVNLQLTTIGGNGTQLVNFNSNAPTTITSTVNVTGLQAGERLRGIDFRPAQRGTLYALTSNNRLVIVNRSTGAITPVTAGMNTTGTIAPVTGLPNIGAGNVGLDFNPVPDRLRGNTSDQVTLAAGAFGGTGGQNFRLNPNDATRVATSDPSTRYVAGDPNATRLAPSIVGDAYTNSFARDPLLAAAAAGTPLNTNLFVIDSANGVLARQGGIQAADVGGVTGTGNPNNGVLFTIGSLNVATNGNVGFDIATGNDGTGSGVRGTAAPAFAILTNPLTNQSGFYQINLTTGAATFLGFVGTGATVTGLAIAPIPFAQQAQTANEQAFGAALDAATAALPFNIPGPGFVIGSDAAVNARARLIGLVGALDSLPLGTAGGQQGLGNFLGEIHGAVPTLAFQFGTQVGNSILDRGSSSAGLIFQLDGFDGSFDQTSRGFGYETQSYGFTIGYGQKLGENYTVGISATYATGDVDYINASRDTADTETYVGNLFANANFGPANITAYIGFGTVDVDTTRNLPSLGAFGQIAAAAIAADYDANLFLAGGRVSYDFDLGSVKLQPYAGLIHTRYDRDAFDESTNSIFGAAVNGLVNTSTQTQVGINLFGTFDLGGVKVVPNVRAAYLYELADDNRTLSITLPALGITTPTAISVARNNDNRFQVGGGLGFESGNFFGSATYNGEFDKDNRTHAARLLLGYRF
jgi:uncharacterized protein YhjY with autotransporter beta-barrel domain